MDLVGHTPMLHLKTLSESVGASVFGKCEFMNPGGSIKDRIGLNMVRKALDRGDLRPGGTIVESTAGNTGMGLAIAAAQYGMSLVAVMTTKMSKEKVDLLRAFGAEVVICPYEVPPTAPEHFINVASEIARTSPNAWLADQFNNADNPEIHELTTGPEVFADLDGDIDAFVAGIGTGGSMLGIGRYLRRMKPDVELVLADPKGSIHADIHMGRSATPKPYWVEGIGGDFIPSNANLAMVSHSYTVTDAEAIDAALRAFRAEGVFLGASSGTILSAALRYAVAPENSGKRIVALLPDGGRSYISTIYNETWRRAREIEIPGLDGVEFSAQREAI